MNSKIFTIFFLIALPNWVHAEKVEGARGTAFGKDHVFSLKAPQGWIIDTESAAGSGVGFVFYPTGTSWKSSKIVLYARARIKDETVQTVAQQVLYTVSDFKSHGSPNYKVDTQQQHILPNKKSVTVVSYSGDQWKNYEMVAYIEERKTINLLVMNAKSEEEFQKNLPIFYNILDSYQFIQD